MAGKKRKATTKAASPAASAKPQKQAKQEDQKTVSKAINVPIDEGFVKEYPDSKVAVHVGDDDFVYDISLNQTNIGNNNNKFYLLQLIEDNSKKGQAFHTFARWGRVGEFGQSKNVGPVPLEAALKEFEKKFKDKTGHRLEDRYEEPKKGKYTFIERNYEDDEEDNKDGDVKKEEDDDEKAPMIESKLSKEVQRLVELIFNENHYNSVLESIGYNQEKLPLGKLGKATLKKGFEHLKEISSLIRHPKLAQNKYQCSQREALEDWSNKYYSTIPHVFGRDRAPIIDNQDILQREVAMLDTLTDLEIGNEIMKTTTKRSKDAESVNMIDKRFEQLSLDEATPLDHKSDEYQALQKYLINTAGHTHNIRYRLQDIYRIRRSGEDERWQKSEFSNRQDSCRRLLWHGSRTTNFGGILSQGLRIAPPEAPANGYAFGKGIYMADVSTKSANYCMSSSSGGHGLLLLCDAELGNPVQELLNADHQADETAKKAGCISTKGIGRTVPQDWIDAGNIHDSLKGVLMPDTAKDPSDQKVHPNAYLQYNEYIAYDVSQLRMKYLFRFSM